MGKNILLVEDEPTLQRILGSVLTDGGHAVETLGTAEAALEALRARDDVDLVLSDKNLPAMNGLELLGHVRAHEKASGRAVGFVLVTGYPSRDSASAVLGQGGDGYLVKPFRSLSHALASIDGVLAADLGARRRSFALAQRVGRVLAGVPEAPLANVQVAVLVDDPAVAGRIGAALTRAGAVLTEAAALPAGTQPVACSTRVDRLVAAAPGNPGVARVLCDDGASFEDLLALIAAGGGAITHPTLTAGT